MIIIIISSAIGIVILLSLFLHLFFLKKRIRNKIENQIYNLELPDRTVLFLSRYLEKLSLKYGLNLPNLCGLDKIWIKKIEKHPNKKYIKKILKYSPDSNLFTIFVSVLNNKKLQPLLVEWMDKSGEFMVLRKIAMSGKGEVFDGKKALELFQDKLSEISEMMGDYEWKTRYFAINILIHSKEKYAEEAVWASFRDPSINVRITTVNLFKAEDRERHYKTLVSLVLDDPVFEVRKAAKARIIRDLQDLYSIEPMKLGIAQQLHFIELLDPDSKQDENIGIEFIKTGNKELELYSSRFLTANGTLLRLFQSADPGYVKGFEDTYTILKIAVESDCTSFLKLDSKISLGSLLIASRILISSGNRDIITDLAERVFMTANGKESISPYREIYENTIKCICKRGNDKALYLLNSEIIRRKENNDFQEWILNEIPVNYDNIFAPTLLNFLKDGNFPAKTSLRKTLKSFPTSAILPEIINILRSDNSKWNSSIKIESLKLLGSLQLPHCTQYLLENLSLLPLNEAKEFSEILITNSQDIFRARVKDILTFGDSSSMAHIIAAMPESERKFFLSDIKNALKNNNPDVRISAAWALSDYNKGELISSCFRLLADPVDKVREEVGMLLGGIATEKIIKVLKETLFDKNESTPVKAAILKGLSLSQSKESTEIILSKIEENVELSKESMEALSKKRSKQEITLIINFMETTIPDIRDKIIRTFREMDQETELIIEKMLETSNQTLKRHIAAILEDSGLVALRIRQLAHRDAAIRKKAAEFLLNTGTKSAYRGIIMAAKDPDEDVRVMVVKALDILNSPKGLPILEQLKNDPEQRVRKYTLWALERYEAKKLI